jgi:hypothetical protein
MPEHAVFAVKISNLASDLGLENIEAIKLHATPFMWIHRRKWQFAPGFERVCSSACPGYPRA